jgi:hypothetical protein
VIISELTFLSPHHPRILGCSQLELTVFISPSGHLFLFYSRDVWPPLSAELRVFLSLSGHLSARADCISVTTSSQNLAWDVRQLLELTAFLSPHHPRILGHLATSISESWQCFCYHIIPESWDVQPPLSARSDSISITVWPPIRQYFRHHNHPRILHGILATYAANSISVVTSSQNHETFGSISITVWPPIRQYFHHHIIPES